MLALINLLNPINHYRFLRNTLKDIRYLRRTYASYSVRGSYIASRFVNGQLTKPYLTAQREFKKLASSLQLSNDWFTANIPFWLSVFGKYRLAEKKEVNILEIGSWEGLSSFFILHSLPNAKLTCVDTWEGADEHKIDNPATKEILSKIEVTFDNNLSIFKDRLIKYKGTSFSYYNDNPARNAFDVIYIDGSHHCDDVMVDAIKCFEMLKVGGIMIFDDYFWKHYKKAIENPAAAINTFLRLKKGSYKIVRLYYQIIIEKTADEARSI